MRELPLAHRGLHGHGVPENSLAAFAAARDAGYGVELDVHLTRDRVPVVLHDPSLRRVAGVRHRIGQLDLAEVGELRLEGTDQRVPTLAAALRELATTPVMVECKSLRPGAGSLEAATAAVLDDHAGPWCVAGFNPASLRWFRRRRPQAVRVLTACAAERSRLPGPLARRMAQLTDLAAVAPVAVSYELEGLPVEPVSRWREVGGTVVVWTARTEHELARAAQLADNVIFEHVRP